MNSKSVASIRRFVGIMFCGLALMSGGTQAFGQSATFTTQAYPIIGNTQVAADFNGDGRLDLAGSGLNAASVMLNNGNGTFSPKIDYPVGFQTQDVAAGDFNGDGKIDLAVSLYNSQVSVAILLGTGTGSFNAPTFLPNTSAADSPAVIATDLNNDGKVDLLVMHNFACFTPPCRGARTVTVLLGNGDGTFQPGREVDVNTFPHSMVAGDFNRDGIKDFAVGGENTELSILVGVGDGTFVLKPVMLLVPGGDLFSACNDVDLGDFNRDGIQDIVVPLGNGNGVAIVLGNGDGTFRVLSRFLEDAVSSPQSIAVADYNGDGFLDLARGMGDGTRGLLQIMHGNGDGSFRPVVNYATPPPGSSVGGGWVIAADFNGDGKSDLALEVRGAGPGTDVLINTSGAAVPPPGSVTLSALALNPSSVNGGSASTGTVTLSRRADTAARVSLSSSSAAATVPASVTVAAGATTANFTINTTQVASTSTATITGTLGSSRTAALTINATAPTADTVSISRAEYDASKRSLRVEATSSRTNATLQLFVTSTGQLIGTLSNNGGGKYSGQFNWSVNPQNVTLRSNFGGTTSRAVTLK